jgi:hypothetical protein
MAILDGRGTRRREERDDDGDHRCRQLGSALARTLSGAATSTSTVG